MIQQLVHVVSGMLKMVYSWQPFLFYYCEEWGN